MERNGFLHRVIPWVVTATMAALACLAGYVALAELLRVPDVPRPADITLRGGGDTGVYRGDGDRVLVIDGKEVQRWRAGPEIRRKGEGWEVCNAAETVCEDVLVPEE